MRFSRQSALIVLIGSFLVNMPWQASAQLTNSDSLPPSGIVQVAETVLAYQRQTGGWPKNYNRKEILTAAKLSALAKAASRNDSTIDNGATYTEIRSLAEAYQETGDERYSSASLRGIDYLLRAQYDNGGWPQYFPNAKGYKKHITFNDSAMIRVMLLLQEVADDRERFSFVSQQVRDRCAAAIDRGTQCILKCQIVVDGKRTAWCAQHDEVTFEPRSARSYELASLSGSESVGVVRFLMKIDDPNDEIVQAIEAAVRWFEKSKLTGIKLVRIKDASLPRGYDRVVVEDPEAPPMWAKFYEINTNKPIYCSRDGIPRESLADISYERRNGYSWLGHYAQKLLDKDLPAWRKRSE